MNQKMFIGKDPRIEINGMGEWDFGDWPSGNEISFTGSFESVNEIPKDIFNGKKVFSEVCFYAPPRKYVLKNADIINASFDNTELSFGVNGQVWTIKYPIEYQYKNTICKFFERIGSLI